jgi:hypothetical protein
VRHVTLSTGQIGVAAATLGWTCTAGLLVGRGADAVQRRAERHRELLPGVPLALRAHNVAAWTARASTALRARWRTAELLCPYARQRLIRWNQARRMRSMQTAERLHPFRTQGAGSAADSPARHQAGHARARRKDKHE